MSDSATPSTPVPPERRLTRRRFLRYGLWGSAAALVGGTGYSLLEAGWIETTQTTITVPRLPKAFSGLRVAFLTDIHHGPFTGLNYVKKIVSKTAELKPDLIVLGGDYCHRDKAYIDPCFDELASLQAPLGVFGVMGNHDAWESLPMSKSAMRRVKIPELTNTGVWLTRGGARLRLCGVGDLWTDEQDLPKALGDAASEDACVLLSHNPDFAESLSDARVGLVLSGHTHGGQVQVPLYGAPYVPSRYGQKYLQGLVQAPATQVYVSRGLGTITPPLRFNCRPELSVITLV
jgi:predicted MPP superfamily phosphohydrolase